MASVTPRPARRARAYVRVTGPDAVDYLDRMLSNDVPDDGSVDALLLTPKARVIAPLLVWRRADDDVLLLTEPELGEVVRRHLVRMRLAARCEVELEQHTSTIVSCRPRPGSTGAPSRSPRVAFPGRSPSPASATGGRSTAACA